MDSCLAISGRLTGISIEIKISIYTARVRAGYISATRRLVFEAIKHLTVMKCPFVSLPEKEPIIQAVVDLIQVPLAWRAACFPCSIFSIS